MAVAQHLPRGRHQAGDRHLKFHEDRDNLCASLEGDSLSQWRAYGADSAYAIELDTNVELKILKSPDTPHLGAGIGLPGWEPVIYEAAAQRADALRRLCFTASMTTDEGDWQAMYFACALTLVGGITRMKHVGFSDEREVRWAATHGTLAPAVNYRPGRLGVTPYVAITPPGDYPTAIAADGQRLYSLTTAMPSKLPIKQVKIGPVKYPRAAEYGLRQLLDCHGYADVPVTQSDVTYRLLR